MSNIVSNQNDLFIGLDVGSTTVKAVVLDAATDNILWYDYQRHETRQLHKVLEFLNTIENEFKGQSDRFRIFITGSGGRTVADLIGAKLLKCRRQLLRVNHPPTTRRPHPPGGVGSCIRMVL